MAATSNLQGEPEAVVQKYDCASIYDTFDGDITIGSVIGYGGIYSAALIPTSGHDQVVLRKVVPDTICLQMVINQIFKKLITIIPCLNSLCG